MMSRINTDPDARIQAERCEIADLPDGEEAYSLPWAFHFNKNRTGLVIRGDYPAMWYAMDEIEIPFKRTGNSVTITLGNAIRLLLIGGISGKLEITKENHWRVMRVKITLFG